MTAMSSEHASPERTAAYADANLPSKLVLLHSDPSFEQHLCQFRWSILVQNANALHVDRKTGSEHEGRGCCLESLQLAPERALLHSLQPAPVSHLHLLGPSSALPCIYEATLGAGISATLPLDRGRNSLIRRLPATEQRDRSLSIFDTISRYISTTASFSTESDVSAQSILHIR